MELTYEVTRLYDRAWHQGWWRKLWTRVRGRPAQLLDLATVAADHMFSACHYLGVQSVPVRQIRGSEGRCMDFDDRFHPIQWHTRSRWQSIAKAWLCGASLPPIDLIRVGDVYFVRDGHYRISVARALGQQEIDAVVAMWDVARAGSAQRPASLSSNHWDTAPSSGSWQVEPV